MATAASPVGMLLRDWRRRRGVSQLHLAHISDVSPRHLSFVETGRSAPSREMVLRLAERLDVPLRERNAMLLAAGYAPAFPQRPFQDPALDAARQAVELVLAGHEPYPALAVDRHWNLLAANKAVPLFMAGADPPLLAPPVNVLRLCFHPSGLASRIANFGEWRAHVLARLGRLVDLTADAELVTLLDELRGYPVPAGTNGASDKSGDPTAVAVPFRFITDVGTLSFISTITIFGTPMDVTLSELALETFFPADEGTARALRAAMT